MQRTGAVIDDNFNDDHEALPLLLKECGRSLKALELDVEELSGDDVSILALHCSNLHRFKLASYEVKTSLAPVWLALGDSILDVQLECPARHRRAALDVLGANCKNITTFSLWRIFAEN